MKKLFFRIAGILAALGAPLIISGAAHAAADTCTWTGGGADENFSNAANWSDSAGPIVECDNGNVPEAGDTLNFPANVTDRNPQNDLTAGISLQAITFTGSATMDSRYTLAGNALTLVGGISSSMTRATNTEQITPNFTLPLTISSNQSFATGTSGIEIDDLNLSTFSITISGGTVNGSITGSGALTSTGYLSLRGDNSAFTGSITVSSGSLVTRSATALGSAVAGTTVAEAAFLSFCSVTSDVTIAEPLTLTGTPGDSTVYASPSTCASNFSPPSTNTKLTLSGPVTLTSDVQFYPDYTDLIISGTYTPNGHAFTVTAGASGTLTLPTGVITSVPIVNTYAADSPTTFINIGNNTTSTVTGKYGDVYITTGGTLKGTGTVGAISINGGKIAPGLSPGCLNSGDLDFVGPSTYEVELGGLTECTQYDQMKVVGLVKLNGQAVLSIVRYNNMVPRINNSFTIISNDGTDTVTGTFSGLTQGATIISDGITYSVSYTGGDGNDVVLVVTAVASSLGAPNTGAHIIKSGIILPLLAIVSALGIVGMNFVSTKKK